MDTRQRFEAWAGSFGWNLDRTDEGYYRTMSTDAAWRGWSAAADEMKKAHARACKEWASICRMQKRHGCSVGASECAKLILASEKG